MPAKYHAKIKSYWKLPRGVSNRLAGLQWVADYGDSEGVLYFADDDNTYDANLFTDVKYIDETKGRITFTQTLVVVSLDS